MQVIAHRGASTVRRENTLPAFTEAVRVGADGVELDVRRTADGDLVVLHDPVLADGRPVVGLRRSEVPSEVPGLAEALDACAPLLVNVEIKDLPGEPAHDRARTTARLVAERLGDPPVHVLVSSFDPGALEVVRAVEPGLDLGLLVVGADPAVVVARAVASGAVALHPADRDVDGALVRSAHIAGLEVNVWTVNDADRQRELETLGVDAVICDDPAAALTALGR